MNRKTVALVAILAVSLLSSPLAVSSALADDFVQLRVGASFPTSWSYSCTVAIAEAVRQVDPSLDMMVQATPGSTNHPYMFIANELDLGTGFTPTDYWANHGHPPMFEEPMEGVFYKVVPIAISKTHILVRDDSTIQSISDLNGRRVSVGEAGGAATQMALNIVEALGLQLNAIQNSRTEAFEMLRDGRLDALILNQGAPFAGVIEFATVANPRFIPFTEDEVATFVEAGPYCFSGYLTSNEYQFIPEPVRTLTQLQNIHANATLDEEIVYRLTKAIVAAWPEVVRVVPAAGSVDPLVDVVKSVTKIHPGAIRYYEERGVVIPDELRP